MKDLYKHPSFYAHALNGILLMVAIIILFMYFDTIKKLGPFEMIIVILLFAGVIGIHGISHLGLESDGFGCVPGAPETIRLSERAKPFRKCDYDYDPVFWIK